MDEPIFNVGTLGFRVIVYSNRIEYKPIFGKKIIPLNKINDIEIPPVWGTSWVNIVLNSGEKIQITVGTNNVKKFISVVSDLLEKNKNVSSISTNALDELEKLAKLKDKGVVTQKEFNLKKKQLLNS